MVGPDRLVPACRARLHTPSAGSAMSDSGDALSGTHCDNSICTEHRDTKRDVAPSKGCAEGWSTHTGPPPVYRQPLRYEQVRYCWTAAAGPFQLGRQVRPG